MLQAAETLLATCYAEATAAEFLIARGKAGSKCTNAPLAVHKLLQCACMAGLPVALAVTCGSPQSRKCQSMRYWH